MIRHRLAQLITSLQQGKQAESLSADEQHQKMMALVEKYGDFEAVNGESNVQKAQDDSSGGQTIVSATCERPGFRYLNALRLQLSIDPDWRNRISGVTSLGSTGWTARNPGQASDMPGSGRLGRGGDGSSPESLVSSRFVGAHRTILGNGRPSRKDTAWHERRRL